MEYKVYLKNLGETVLKYADAPLGEYSGKSEKEEKFVKEIDGEIELDFAGNWCHTFSLYCPANVQIEAFVSEAERDFCYDAHLDSNYVQHIEFNNITCRRKISTQIKTRKFDRTDFRFFIHTNTPRSKIKYHLEIKI